MPRSRLERRAGRLENGNAGLTTPPAHSLKINSNLMNKMQIKRGGNLFTKRSRFGRVVVA
jgi:hypothetical protein